MAKTIVVGGGVSGIVCSIVLKRGGVDVTVLEKNASCLKKLLVTGNGKCNYYNDDQSLKHYHSANLDIVEKIITKNNLEEVVRFFDSIGIMPRVREGYYYPYSNQAVSVCNLLLTEARALGVEICNNVCVLDVCCHNGEFLIKSDDRDFRAQQVVFAGGSPASFKSVLDVNSYSLAQKLGHSIIKVLPSLVQLQAEGAFLKEWSGVRADAHLKLLENNEIVREEDGEILLTNYGISGICVMQLSGGVARGLDQKKKEEVIINFLPEIAGSRGEFISFMEERCKLLVGRNITELLDGVLNYKLVNTLVKRSQLASSKRWHQLSIREKNILASNFVDFRLEITGTNSFSRAQVASGGVPLTEIDPRTMESKIVKGLYLTGEILDVDGDCGGYNLTFAFLSGILAGKAGGRRD